MVDQRFTPTAMERHEQFLHVHGFVLDRRGPWFSLRPSIHNLPADQPFPGRLFRAHRLESHDYAHALYEAVQLLKAV